MASYMSVAIFNLKCGEEDGVHVAAKVVVILASANNTGMVHGVCSLFTQSWTLAWRTECQAWHASLQLASVMRVGQAVGIARRSGSAKYVDAS